MKFLLDRCVGRKLAAWLAAQGHGVIEAQSRHPDPGDRAILAWAAAEARILVTMDKDFGLLVFGERIPHAGLVRLPHVRPDESVAVMGQVLSAHAQALDAGAVITVRGRRIRISRPEQR